MYDRRVKEESVRPKVSLGIKHVWTDMSKKSKKDILCFSVLMKMKNDKAALGPLVIKKRIAQFSIIKKWKLWIYDNLVL